MLITFPSPLRLLTLSCFALLVSYVNAIDTESVQFLFQTLQLDSNVDTILLKSEYIYISVIFDALRCS